MFWKTLIKIATVVAVAVISFAGVANAGCKRGGHGFHNAHSVSYSQKLRAKKAAKARKLAAAKRKKKLQLAKARKAAKARAAAKAKAEAIAKAEAEKAAAEKVETADVAGEPAEAAEATVDEQKVAAVAETCSKFIAATGTTIEVECETTQ